MHAHTNRSARKKEICITSLHTHIHTYIHTYTHTYIHTRKPGGGWAFRGLCAYIHTYTHTYTHTNQVVGELFEGYVRTGALHKPWGVVDLDGDAIPTVFDVRILLCMVVCMCVCVRMYVPRLWLSMRLPWTWWGRHSNSPLIWEFLIYMYACMYVAVLQPPGWEFWYLVCMHACMVCMHVCSCVTASRMRILLSRVYACMYGMHACMHAWHCLQPNDFAIPCCVCVCVCVCVSYVYACHSNLVSYMHTYIYISYLLW
jgi:hypothetical protein